MQPLSLSNADTKVIFSFLEEKKSLETQEIIMNKVVVVLFCFLLDYVVFVG